MHSLELSLASQASLPSVGSSHSGVGLCEEVFNILPGTVNLHRSAATYNLQDQAFSFQKQERFEDNSNSPNLKPDLGPHEPLSSQPVHSTTLPLSSHQHPHNSTLFHATRTLLHNKTFDVSQIAPLTSNPQDAASIAAEVSTAVAAQASKEFHHMHEPKITKFKGGYSTDTELVFHSWHADILLHITDHELDKRAVIQLIKDQILESTHCKDIFQIDLCGGTITYQELLKHLSMAFQGGNDEANILAEFYRHSQHAKELEEIFVDELQLLARKVISKKPNFQINLDTTLKQQYASQLYDHNSTSIAKTLLLQMPQVSFTQFRNELARVLRTHQHPNKSSSGKSISTFSVGVKSEEEGTVFKSQSK